MESMSGHMDPFMHNVFWHENQVCITLQLSPEYSPSHVINQEADAAGEAKSILASFRGEPQGSFPPTFSKAPAIAAMQLPKLRDNLALTGYRLTSFTISQTLQPEPGQKQPEGDVPKGEVAKADTENDINSEVGKYLFATRDKEQNFVPTLICFFNFMKGNMASSGAARTLADLPYMFETAASPARTSSLSGMSAGDMKRDQNGDDKGNSQHGHGNGEGTPISPVVDLVKLINTEGKLKELRDQGVPIVAASPIWFAGATSNGSTGPQPVGCPLTPPIPVPGNVGCSTYPGLFPITMPELPSILRSMTGDGVTVFVLDTLPRRADIHRAVEAAEKRNLLLLDVAENVKFHHNRLPASLEEPGPSHPATGKDINGKLIGFRMPDHGLFVAGIIRDLAPHARIECVRVLNDFCVGDLPTLSKALETIQHRMSPQDPDNNNLPGDLVGKPVVINMSLVIPPDSELKDHGFDESDLAYLRKELQLPIEGLAESGVVFVASAGNEGDLRYPPANPDGIRPEALYPAAFAYNFMKYPYMMIPVGAVDKHGNAASYSCYPGEHGIGTYGGEVPKASKKKSDNCYTQARKIDAPIGLYTAMYYPSLSVDDCEPTYPEPNADAWAYWVGTSFATPIIAAVVARILEYIIRHVPPGTILTPNTHVWHGLTEFAVSGRTVTWDRIGVTKETKVGPMLLAVQKQCKEEEEEEEEREEEIEVVMVDLAVNELGE